MRNIEKPKFDSIDVLKLCISKIKDVDLKERLTNIEVELKNAVDEFEDKAPNLLLHTIKKHSKVNGNVSKDEMVKVYDQRMVNAESPGRTIYNQLMKSAKYGLCPLCGHRIVNTLDHYLPKTVFPIYSVVPINIVPACSACNRTKFSITATCPDNEFIHPYYDDLESEEWLCAEVIQSKPISIRFYVSKPDKWDQILFNRVKNHLELLELNYLYSTHSAVELISIESLIKEIYRTGGSHAVKDHLNSCYKSKVAVSLNWWQTVFYKALFDSEWYHQLNWS